MQESAFGAPAPAAASAGVHYKTMQQANSQTPAAQSAAIQNYIRRTWKTLTRSHADLARAAADPKMGRPENGRWPVYVPASEDPGALERKLRGEMPASAFSTIALLPLPSDPNADLKPHGLLYLPRPYVVPGGRFNEMYGWDSYFIQLGLLRDGEIELARDMAGNFIYEIDHYGKILNANRTYYLSRSQPPFFTTMLWNVYQRSHERQWLAGALPALEKYYAFWTAEPHLTPATGLSRYYDTGLGPAPEAVSAELDAEGRTEYDDIREYFRTHEIADYDVSHYYDRAADRLTQAFYTGDRSMRESGFDPSSRYGPFSAAICEYNPVCLNSLLYQMEEQAATICSALGQNADAARWRGRARIRGQKVRELMWDETAGLFFDYAFASKKRRDYPFLTTFYPLWTGIATREQAARVAANLTLFESPGGLRTSTTDSGDQWDSPYGWAPISWIALEGLRRYGYNAEADRVSVKFLSVILGDFLSRGTIVEKYDVVNLNRDVGAELKYGYHSNETGFGWTNAAYTTLWDRLPERVRSQVRPPAAR